VPRDLSRILRPQSIAVFGGVEAEIVIQQLQNAGYPGAIWPLHPRKETVGGLPCHRHLEDLPGPPDVAFVGVNRNLSIEIVARLARAGAGGAVCYASGFGEVADGAALQADLVAAAGEMPILGPNCYGLVNYLDGALIWPSQHGGERSARGVAIVGQSSNILINLTMQQRALPIAYILTAGNQAQTGLSDLAAAALDDPRVTALGLHIEGFDDVSRLAAVFAKARAKGVPVAVLKVGRSSHAQQLTMSHTASLAGSDALASAFFRRCGAARVDSLAGFLESLKLLHTLGPSPDRSIASMSCSGGEASLIADRAMGRALDFRRLTQAEHDRIEATLSDLVTVSNPLDYHTFIWADEPRMAATYEAVIGCGFGLTLLVLDIPRLDRCDQAEWDMVLRAIATAKQRLEARGQKVRAGVVASLPESMPEATAKGLLAEGIVPLNGFDEALAAAEAAATIGAAWQRPPPAPLAILRGSRVGKSLSEWDSKRQLAAAGIAVPEGRLATSVEEAVTAAEALGYPVAVKASGAALAHKTELGAVQLNLHDAAAVRAAAERVAPLGEAILVERMVEGAVAELILGLSRDPQFGLTLTIGAGGILVELLQDAVPLLLPVNGEAVREAILSLKSAPLLAGFRGKPKADIEAAVAAALALARFAEREGTQLVELDVNPLILRAEGQGAVAADALMRLGRELINLSGLAQGEKPAG